MAGISFVHIDWRAFNYLLTCDTDHFLDHLRVLLARFCYRSDWSFLLEHRELLVIQFSNTLGFITLCFTVTVVQTFLGKQSSPFLLLAKQLFFVSFSLETHFPLDCFGIIHSENDNIVIVIIHSINLSITFILFYFCRCRLNFFPLFNHN